MPLDPRTPVIVGAGQLTRRPTDVADCPEPIALMEEAARRAGSDSGAEKLLRLADSVQVVASLSHLYPNAPAELARRLGAEPAETVQSSVGGNGPQQLVNEAALAIQAGRADVVVIAGGEAIHSRHLAHRAGVTLPWPTYGDAPPPDRTVGIGRPGTTEAERARSVVLPIQVYPVFETALRLAAGASVPEHLERVSRLWEGFSTVAAGNPFAWDQVAHTAEEIRRAGPGNRWIGWPYTKLMNAYDGVDQAAALILTSVEAARSAGVAEDRWVFPWAGADSHDHWYVSERWDLCSSVAMAANARAALGLAGIGIDDVAHVDLYSCFPSAVQMGAAGLGLDLFDRPLTVTGGLAFAGGPLNNYVTHSIATMTGLLRAEPDSIGLCTALGWYATKHSIGIYSSRPPERGFAHAHPQDAVRATPSRRAAVDHAGPVTVEAWSVMHDRSGAPSLGVVACLTPDGGRAWANVTRPDGLQALLTTDVGGLATVLGEDGDLDL